MTDPSTNELKWRQYALLVDLYKFYLEIFLKFNIFFYAVTGGILSVYIAKLEQPAMRFALLLPIVMAIFFACIFLYGAARIHVSEREVAEITHQLSLNSYPAIHVLAIVLTLGAVLLFLIAAGLLALVLRCATLT